MMNHIVQFSLALLYQLDNKFLVSKDTPILFKVNKNIPNDIVFLNL
jgi:hypothetical protein